MRVWDRLDLCRAQNDSLSPREGSGSAQGVFTQSFVQAKAETLHVGPLNSPEILGDPPTLWSFPEASQYVHKQVHNLIK